MRHKYSVGQLVHPAGAQFVEAIGEMIGELVGEFQLPRRLQLQGREAPQHIVLPVRHSRYP